MISFFLFGSAKIYHKFAFLVLLLKSFFKSSMYWRTKVRLVLKA